MTIRETIEDWEFEYLSPYAAHSKDSKGREVEEEQCDIRPVYQRDRDRILHSKAFRRQNVGAHTCSDADRYHQNLQRERQCQGIQRRLAARFHIGYEGTVHDIVDRLQHH